MNHLRTSSLYGNLEYVSRNCVTEIRAHSMIPSQQPSATVYSSLWPPVQCIKLLDSHIVSSILVVTRGRQVHSPDIPS